MLIFTASAVAAQRVSLDKGSLVAVKVHIGQETIDKKTALKVIKDSTVRAVDEPTFARVPDTDFHNGTIEVRVRSRFTTDAPGHARGFIGVAFRINDDNSKFECIYLRPDNARAPEQIRRNHTIQYFSYPSYKFDRLREQAPGEYESYTDMAMDEWINIKIVVKDEKALLFINGNPQPSLIVNDLKHGKDMHGKLGLWVDIGTEGYFRDLRVTKD